MKTGMHSGVVAAMTAAVLFGAGTPLAKLLLTHMSPWLLAALLYLGSGIGLWIVRRIRRAPAAHLGRGDWSWLAGAIVAGGMVGPVLLMLGLSAMPASGASLLLNAEGVLTALLAWFAFKENIDHRIALGMLSIVAGAVVLSWPQETHFADAWPALWVLGACLAWAIDNNLTRKVSLSDAPFIAMAKGVVAGSTNLVLALLSRAAWPDAGAVTGAALLGFASYGASLTLFVIGLRHLGAARTGAYFSVAPFFGAVIAVVLLGEPVTPQLLSAGLLMAFGVWLHLTERHEHGHMHEVLEHNHEHVHGEGDDHHDLSMMRRWPPERVTAIITGTCPSCICIRTSPTLITGIPTERIMTEGKDASSSFLSRGRQGARTVKRDVHAVWDPPSSVMIVVEEFLQPPGAKPGCRYHFYRAFGCLQSP